MFSAKAIAKKHKKIPMEKKEPTQTTISGKYLNHMKIEVNKIQICLQIAMNNYMASLKRGVGKTAEHT